MAHVLVPSTLQATDHGLEIHCNGEIIGGIAQWSWAQSAKNTRARAFGGSLTGVGSAKPLRGEAFENVPGNLESVTIQFSRCEIWNASFVDAFKLHQGAIQLLNFPMQLVSFLQAPDGQMWTYTFYGARFDSFNQAHDVNGDRMIKGTGTISCQTMRITTPTVNIPTGF